MGIGLQEPGLKSAKFAILKFQVVTVFSCFLFMTGTQQLTVGELLCAPHSNVDGLLNSPEASLEKQAPLNFIFRRQVGLIW